MPKGIGYGPKRKKIAPKKPKKGKKLSRSSMAGLGLVSGFISGSVVSGAMRKRMKGTYEKKQDAR